MHILLAEDNLGDELLIRQALEEHQVEHELHVVRDGGEALAFVDVMGQPGETPRPNLVLLDLNLPKANGSEILSEFRKHPAAVAHTPVIAVTSSDTPKDRAQMAELGVVRYFKKPSDLGAFLELEAAVREVVATGQADSTIP